MELNPVVRAGECKGWHKCPSGWKGRDLPTQVYTRSIITVNYRSFISGHQKFQFSLPLKGLSFARVLGKEDGVETGIGHLLTAPGSQSPCVLLRIPVVLVPVWATGHSVLTRMLLCSCNGSRKVKMGSPWILSLPSLYFAEPEHSGF